MAPLDLEPPKVDIVGDEADVPDCFWNFTIDELADWFAINEPLTAREWWDMGFKFNKIYEPSINGPDQVDASEILYPCVRAMSMGWSWALYFAHDIVTKHVQEAYHKEHWILAE